MKMPPWLEGAVAIEILNKRQVSVNRVVHSPHPSEMCTGGQAVRLTKMLDGFAEGWGA